MKSKPSKPPGCRTLNTFFLLNAVSRAEIEARSPRISSRHFGSPPLRHTIDGGVVRVRHLDRPEAVIAYEEDFVRRAHARAGLRIEEPVRYGRWCGRDSSQSRIRQPGHHCRRPRLTKRCRRSPPRSIMRIRSPTRTSRPRTSSPGVPTRNACKPRGSASGLYGVGTGPAEAPEPAPPETPKPVALESGLRPTALDSPREPEP